MKKILSTLVHILLFVILLSSCATDDLNTLYQEQAPGKIIIRGYSALPDSIQVVANSEPLIIGEYDAFIGEIANDYEFVFYDNKSENIDIVNKVTGEIMHSYSFTAETPVDTLSFYQNDGIWIDDVLSFEPGVLSGTGRTGYRFIFPTMNRYSSSGYEGPIDAIIKKVNGEVLAVAENITKENFGTFVEFAFAPPPIINVQLVKHGTTESYVAGQQVIVQMVMQNNKSRLVVLDEKTDGSGAFSGVDGTIDLVDYFDY